MTKILETKPAKRKSWKIRFMADVYFFHVKTGMKYEAIGLRSIRNPRFWDRLLKGGTIMLESVDQVYKWMAVKGYHFNNEGACYVEARPGSEKETRRRKKSGKRREQKEGQDPAAGGC